MRERDGRESEREGRKGKWERGKVRERDGRESGREGK